jgi:hypothetical protein
MGQNSIHFDVRGFSETDTAKEREYPEKNGTYGLLILREVVRIINRRGA